MKKRLISLLLAALMIFSTLGVYGAATRPFSPGIWEFKQELSGAIEVSNAVATPNKLTINGGGYVTYDFTMPFDAGEVTITYETAQEANIKMTTETQEYTAVLSKKENSVNMKLLPERMGAFKVTYSVDKTVIIKDILFTKEKVKGGVGYDEVYLTPLTYSDAYEEALRSTVIVAENCNTVKVKNALRRIDMADPKITAKVINGKLSMPIGALAHALGLYFEDYADLKYAYMSGENFAWYFKDGENWYENTGKRVQIENKPVYEGDILYVPVRDVAEAMGHTVDWREGFAAIGMRTEIKNILWNEDIFGQLMSEMEQFKVQENARQGKVYHVSASGNGNDKNPGTEDFPFATVQRAVNMASAGDTVIVHDGTYRESVTFPNDGTPTAPIIIKAAEGEKPVISAFEEVTGFAPYTNPQNGVKMYTKDVSNLEFEMVGEGTEWTDDRNFLIYNGKTLLEGRHPNSETAAEKTQMRWYERGKTYEEFTFKEMTPFNPYYPDLETNEIMPTRGDMRIRDQLQKGAHKVYTHTFESDIDLNQEQKDYWKGATVQALVGMAWSLSQGVVSASEYGKLYVDENWNGSYGFTYYEKKYATDYAWLSYHINTVDMPGEWYINMDEKILYIIPPEGVNAEDLVVEAKARQQVLDLTDRKYIQIENINSIGGGLTMNRAEGCILNGGTHKYISQAATVMSEDPDYARVYTRRGRQAGTIPVDKEDAPEYGEMGFYIGGQNNAIVNTDIEYSAGAGIYLTGKRNYIYNNMVDKTGYGGTYVAGIYITKKTGVPRDTIKGGHAIYSNTSWAAYRAAIGIGYGRQDQTVHNDSITKNVWPVEALDIAYNEFAWSNIAARDTGIEYFCYIVGGDDQERSQYHHNSMHDAAGPRTDSIMSGGLYLDGGVSSFDDYNNISYSTSSDDVYRTQAYFRWGDYLSKELGYAWANWSDEYGHEGGLEMNNTIWPNAMSFHIGCVNEETERFMDNYNNVQRKDIIMLGDQELKNGAYTNDEDYAIIPTEEASIEGPIELGEKGTIVSVYYSADKYGKTIYNCPDVTVQIYDGDKLICNQTKIAAAFGRYLDSTAKVNFYIPDYVQGENLRFKITSDQDGLRFRKMAVTDFDYQAENAKRTFPYDALPIILGDVDEIIPTGNHTVPSITTNFTDAALENYSYAGLKDTWDADFVYKDKIVDHEISNVVYIIGSNYTYSNIKIKIKATNKETGEEKEIGYVDCSDIYPKGIAWHTEHVKGVLYEPLKPGTYDFYLDFGIAVPTSETEPRTVGSGDATAMIFF